MRIEDQIKAIKENNKPVSNFPLFYQERLRDFPVYEVDINLLRFNVHNGRIGSEALEYSKAEKAESIEEMDVNEANNLIAGWLWAKSEAKNKVTLKDIEQKTQIKPGVITSDGIIVDGNRRFMLIRRLNESGKNIKFKTIILDESYSDGGNTERDIKMLEAQLQFGEDEKVEYGPIEKYLRVKDFVEKYIDVRSPTMNYNQLTKIMKFKSEAETIKIFRISSLMMEYLDFIGSSNIVSRLANTEDLFINLEKVYSLYSENKKGRVGWNFSDDDAEDFKTTGYNLIRWIYNVSSKNKGDWDPKRIREIYFKNSANKTIFSHKSVWEKFNETIEDIDEINVPDVNDLVNDGMNLKDAAKKVDVMWSEEVSNSLKEALGKAKSRIDDKRQEGNPNKFLEDALQKLFNLIDEDAFLSKSEIKFNDNILRYLSDENQIQKNFDLVNNIRKIAERIKKELS